MDKKIDTSVFKAYDIRGHYPDEINEAFAYKLGAAFATLRLQEEGKKSLTVVVGHDIRQSSPSLQEKLTQGIIDMGLNVIEIGYSSTPTFYFAVAYYGYDGGVLVSASHNAKDFNGFKLVRSRSIPISGDTGINDLKDLVIANKFNFSKTKGKTTYKEEVLEEEVEAQIKNFNISRSLIKPFKIVIDAANAMGSLDITAMFDGLPCEIIELNFTLDGTFPAHQPDPINEENLKQIKEAVIEHQADLGFAIDGDGDRYTVIDNQGNTVRQEIMRGIMSQIVLQDYPGTTICYDIRPGRITREMIESSGGKAVVTKVGHSLIKEKMLKVDAVFGGESSGHFFYRFDYGTFEAPTVFVLKFLQYLAGHNIPLSDIIKPYQKYYHSGEINSVVDNPELKIMEIKDKFQDADNILEVDGITIEYDNFWFNVRKSNTESKLRLNLEAITEKVMLSKKEELLKLIRS